ncbi:MAG: peptidase and in kexin sedolisin, partial [Blastococcus sp.]|nr:peptidase and in kexin sedolisin [Blastococcus sp.]
AVSEDAAERVFRDRGLTLRRLKGGGWSLRAHLTDEVGELAFQALHARSSTQAPTAAAGQEPADAADAAGQAGTDAGAAGDLDGLGSVLSSGDRDAAGAADTGDAGTDTGGTDTGGTDAGDSGTGGSDAGTGTGPGGSGTGDSGSGDSGTGDSGTGRGGSGTGPDAGNAGSGTDAGGSGAGSDTGTGTGTGGSATGAGTGTGGSDPGTGTGGSATFPGVGPFGITSMSPTTVSSAGGTVVTITGTALPVDPRVLIGTSAAATVTRSSTTSLTFRTPARADGVYDVHVFARDGQESVLEAALTFVTDAEGAAGAGGSGAGSGGTGTGGTGTGDAGTGTGGTGTGDPGAGDTGSGDPGTGGAGRSGTTADPVVSSGPGGQRLVRTSKFAALGSIWSLDCSTSCAGVAI